MLLFSQRRGAQASALNARFKNFGMRSKFEGFILAGGKSSRMKTDKAFLKTGGETFLERAVYALKPACGEVKIVVGEKQKAKFEEAFPSFDFVFDIYAERGALGGVHAALKNCASDWAVILAVDLPLVTGEAIEILARTAVESKEEISAVAPRQPDGRLQPLCAVYRAANCFTVAEKLLNEKTSVSMRDFLRLVPTQIVEASDLPVEDLFFNVNQPSDFRALP